MKNISCLAILAIICFASCQSAEELYKEGESFYKGSDGTAQDVEKAISLFKKAAKKGYPEANYTLGTIAIEKGNLQEGLEWFDKLVDSGEASAAERIGDLFYYGAENVPADKSSAVKYYNKAIELDEADADVYNKMGGIYYNGDGVSIDYGKAFNYIKRAADLNDPLALYNLAICYYNGNGVEMNRDIAMEYIRKSADLNFPAAKEYLETVRRQEEMARQQEEWARQQEYERQMQAREDAINNQVISCPGCQGRGRRRGTGFNAGGTEICPYCGGAGVVTYGFARKYGLIN